MEDLKDEVITEVEESKEDQKPDALSSHLQESMWGDEGVKQQQQKEQKVAEKPDEDEDEIIDVPDWLKREFDVDDPEILKKEREEYKQLKNQKPKEFEFKNEDSKKYFEYAKEDKWQDLYNFLDKRNRIEKLSSADATNKQTAIELVKFGLKNDNPNLTDDDIDFLFNEKYTIPEKPVQAIEELDSDYKQRVENWQTQVNNLEKRLTIEAKMAQPKLAQLKSELVLPDIPAKQNAQQQPTQEELDRFAKDVDNFVQVSEKTINDFKGFSAKVKDKDVEVPVSYDLSKEERKFISDKMNGFAKSGFNTNDIFKDKWVNEDGSLNVSQMTEDLSRLYYGDKVSQKFAGDAMGKRLEMYLKQKKNINFNDVNKGGDFRPNEGESSSERLQKQFWGS